MVAQHASGGVRDDGLTEAGFLYLHTIFIQRGRLETTWTVLRKFGYGEDLRLREEYLNPKFEVPGGVGECSVELSQLGYEFLTEVFEIYDKVCSSPLILCWGGSESFPPGCRIRMGLCQLRS